jgi:murein DD-endopeptidase MepM/ murein hydrolase activator NlpD
MMHPPAHELRNIWQVPALKGQRRWYGPRRFSGSKQGNSKHMNMRKLAVALTSAGLATAGLGAAVLPGDAMMRQVDVGDAVDEVKEKVPEVEAPEVPLPEPPAPAPAPPAEPAPPPPQQPAPPPSGDSGSGSDSDAPSSTTETTPERPSSAPEQGPEPKVGAKKGKRQKTTGEEERELTADELAAEEEGEDERGDRRRERRRRGTDIRTADGLPTLDNPGLSLAIPGAAPVGVPNFFIDKFRIPPFLLSIYQAAGIEYGVRWEVLAAINEIETDYGRNLNVSSAGALGWMQFMPATWKAYGVDANGDKRKDPYNPVDAIFAAARYLKAAGAEKDLRRAIFAYNHADWYVDSVLMRARLIGGLPTNLVGSLTGLTQGQFPVHARARYADDISEREATKRVAKGRNAAVPVESTTARRGINVYAKPGSPVVAVQDGKIVKIGTSERLGKFIQLRDVFGNTYTYANLASVADRHPVPKRESVTREEIRKELKLPAKDPKPTRAASAGTQRKGAASPSAAPDDVAAAPERLPEVQKDRLFAAPRRPAAYKAGGEEQLLESGSLAGGTFSSYFVGDFGLDEKDVRLRKLEVGSKVIGGTILGRIGRTSEAESPHMLFEIRPAGRGAPRIDPKPILDGWKLLESTAIYRAKGKNPFFGRDARTPSIGQILLMGKSELENRVVENPRIELYECGERDIRGSRIDRRVLATLEFLASSGLRPTVTSLQCGHSTFTASGNVSHHSTGTAVDIAKINGVPVLGHQGKGSITDLAVRRLLTLQGTMKPAQIITLMTYEGTDNTVAMGDHHDHIHIGWTPMFGANSKAGRQLNAVLKPGQWIKLIDRLGEIDNPTVRAKPSKYAVTVKPDRASDAHRGE